MATTAPAESGAGHQHQYQHPAGGTDRLAGLRGAAAGAGAVAGAASGSLHTAGRNLAEHVSDHAEHVDFFSENTIGAVVTCFGALLIWLVFMPIFHLGVVPYMQGWEKMHLMTVLDYMGRAEETYTTPHLAFEVLDADGSLNCTIEEFTEGSKTFKRPPFEYPADIPPIFNAIDANHDGEISSAEFYLASPSGLEEKWHMNMGDLKQRAKEGYGFLDAYFTAMDVDENGQVNEQEFVSMAKNLQPPVPEPDAKALFRETDVDKQGFITPREWVSYQVIGNFTFEYCFPPAIKPDDARALSAVEVALRLALQTMEFDLLTVAGVEDVSDKPGVTTGAVQPPKNAPPPPKVKVAGRLLAEEDAAAATTALPPAAPTTTFKLPEDKGCKKAFDRVSFGVLLGTRARQEVMQNVANTMPTNIFMGEFRQALTGGSTTAPIEGTLAPAHAPGPISDEDLKAYMKVPTVIQGHTVIYLYDAAAGVHSVKDQEGQVKPIFENTMNGFCKCTIEVESVQTSMVQDQTGQELPTNKTMIVSWSSDLKNGGEFQKSVEDNGHELMKSLYNNIMAANLPAMVGVKLDSWTRLSSTYYSEVAATLPRGAAVLQRTGHFQEGTAPMRNDTGTPPFVTHP